MTSFELRLSLVGSVMCIIDIVKSLQGIMSKKQKSFRLKSIRKVEVKQTTIQGIFGVGDIIFTAAGNNMVVFCGIKSPSGFKEKILKAQK